MRGMVTGLECINSIKERYNQINKPESTTLQTIDQTPIIKWKVYLSGQ